MKIIKTAKAGTFESNDIYVLVMENKGIKIEIESTVILQFGDEIKKAIEETLEKLEVKDVYIKVEDKGALDFTIRARVETAIKRGADEYE